MEIAGEKWLKIEKVNNVTARIITNYPNLFQELYNYFSVYVEGYRFMPKYKMGIWDGKVNFLNKNGLIPLGLTKYVFNFAQRDGLNFDIDSDIIDRYEADDFAEITDKWLKEEWIPRPHQVTGALKALKYGRCIIEHATSSGKSLTIALAIMYNLISKRCSKVLLLVPNIGLVKQMTTDLIEYGVDPSDIGNFYQDAHDTEQSIIISTWQSIYKRPQFIQEFDMLVADEVHGLRAGVVRSVSENAINAKFRIGCTGTMPDPKADRYMIEGAIGPVVDQVTAKDLIDAGHASDIIIKIPFIMYSESVLQKIKGVPFDVEKKFLEEYDKRNNLIKFIVNKHHSVDHNVLVLVDHIEHANVLFEKMKSLGDDRHVFIVTGATDGDDREQVRKFVNENKKCVIVATYGVFSTGISIKRLHAVVFGSAGKSKIKTLQSIGRGLRLHKEKSLLTLYDIGDNLHYSEKHLQNRLEIYAKSQFDIESYEIKLKED